MEKSTHRYIRINRIVINNVFLIEQERECKTTHGMICLRVRSVSPTPTELLIRQTDEDRDSG